MSAAAEAEIRRRALQLWREREMRFPAFTRRMTPDALDMTSGAWARMMMIARAEERYDERERRR